MNAEKKSKSEINDRAVPQHTRLKLWVKSAGREEGIDRKAVKHFSIFAIGPQPLLMFLGKCIGDTIPANLYQSHRNIEDTSQTWTWQEEERETQTPYMVQS